MAGAPKSIWANLNFGQNASIDDLLSLSINPSTDVINFEVRGYSASQVSDIVKITDGLGNNIWKITGSSIIEVYKDTRSYANYIHSGHTTRIVSGTYIRPYLSEPAISGLAAKQVYVGVANDIAEKRQLDYEDITGLGLVAKQGDGDKGDITVSLSGSLWSIDENDYNLGAFWLWKGAVNDSGSTIERGTPVYITGNNGDKINIAPADASNPAKMPAVGIVREQIADGAEGIVVIGGTAKLIDVASGIVGQTLYVASGVGFTNIKPTYPNLVQNIGKITKDGNNGNILVFGPGRTNDIPNLASGHVFIGGATGNYDTRQLVASDIGGLGPFATLSDGDRGDITTSVSGTVWTVDNSAITYAKIQNISDTDKILGRYSSGFGIIEEITCTAAGRALLDDNSAADQRATLLLSDQDNVTFAGVTIVENGLNETPLTVRGYSLTGSGSVPMVALSGAWNTTSAPTLINVDLNDIASNVSGLLLDMKVSGSTRYQIGKDGSTAQAKSIYMGIPANTALNTSNNPGIYFSARSAQNAPPAIFQDSGDVLSFYCNYGLGKAISITDRTTSSSPASYGYYFANGLFRISHGWGGTGATLVNEASHSLALRNAASAQAFRVYNTYTDASNYERGKFGWNSNVLEIGAEAAGTGIIRKVAIVGDKVGIGTTNPEAKLDVISTDAGVPGIIRMRNTNSVAIVSGWEFAIGAPGQYDSYFMIRRTGQPTPGDFYLDTGGTPTFNNDVQIADNKRIKSASSGELAYYQIYRAASGSNAVISWRNHTAGTPSLFTFNAYHNNGSSWGAQGVLHLVANSHTDRRVGIGTSAPSGMLHIAGYALSGTEASSSLYIDQTWNTTGTPTAIFANITDTASNSASLLIDLKVGGTTQCKVAKNGQLTANRLTSAAIIENAAGIYADNSSIRTQSAGYFGFSSTGSVFGTPDIRLYRDAAGVFAQRDGSNTQALRVYRTWTDASNYEALQLAHATYSSAQYSILGAISAGTGAANINLVLSPKGSGAIVARLPDGTGTGGNARGSRAVDLQMVRDSNIQVASGSESFVVGYGNRASASFSFAGGYSNVAAGSSSIAIGNSNTASAIAATALGQSNLASSNAATAVGQANTSSGLYSVTGGIGNTASDNSAVALGAYNRSSAPNSFSSGRYALANKWGQHAHAASNFSSEGDAQRSYLVARQATTDAIPTELFLDGTAVRATLPNNTRWFADVRVVGTNNSSGASARTGIFHRRCLIRKFATAGSTEVIGEVQTIGSDIGTEDGSPPTGWDVTLSADTTNGSLRIEVTGESGVTIRWVAEVSLVEVAYA